MLWVHYGSNKLIQAFFTCIRVLAFISPSLQPTLKHTAVNCTQAYYFTLRQSNTWQFYLSRGQSCQLIVFLNSPKFHFTLITIYHKWSCRSKWEGSQQSQIICLTEMLSSTPILGTPPLKPETALKHVINKFKLIVRA
jgi:hypothetical protein